MIMITDRPDFESPSREILDPEIWARFLDNSENPALVSFPRTGSHWLRMLVELTTGCPSLKRQFFYYTASRFTFWHTHDDDLSFQRKRVVYLYRDPINTTFSQLQYAGADLQNRETVLKCSDQYLRHLQKWLEADSPAREKLVISYQDLAKEPEPTVEKVVKFLGMEWRAERCRDAVQRVTKEVVRLKTQLSDEKVVSIKQDYAAARNNFRKLHGPAIRQNFLQADPSLEAVFESKPS